MKVVHGLFTLLVSAALVLSCGPSGDDAGDGGPNPSPTPKSKSLASGTYDYLIHSVPVDTCWAPPKTNPPVPASVVADVRNEGDKIIVTPVIQDQLPQEFVLTRDGDKLSGVSNEDVDLSTTPLGIDCVINVSGTFDGTVVDDNQFEAIQTVHLTEVGGSACFLLVGSLDDNQLDQIPCDITLEGDGVIQAL